MMRMAVTGILVCLPSRSILAMSLMASSLYGHGSVGKSPVPNGSTHAR